MPVSLYDFTVPVYIRGMNTLSHVLNKAEEYADEKGIPLSEVVGWKLIDDMRPLTFQIQTACNTVKNSLARVTGLEFPAVEDNETTMEQLQERIAKTLDLLNKVDAKAFAGKEDANLTVSLGPRQLDFTGLSYLQTWGLPNFYFHLTTAYDILRSKGVQVGKNDYIGGGKPTP